MPIYAIYGFVRYADEIVDTFHEFDKKALLDEFAQDTYKAIDKGISLNPVLHSFQVIVNRYNIDKDLIEAFLHSMEMDLDRKTYDRAGYETYILGSAEVVGLMCLKVFCEGNDALYEELKAPAMRLGAAFQKINFLRDLGTDHLKLGRSYFPDLDPHNFNDEAKKRIEAEILADFEAGLEGIIRLPRKARFGVYVAYVYYTALFKKIASLRAANVLQGRIRISDGRKASVLVHSYVRHRLDLI
jgi:phytoene/squalene synthetase